MENIRERTIEIDGYSFVREKGRPYYKSSSLKLQRGERSPIYLHRYIYEKYHGPIPEGYDVHHKDGNPYNNSCDNLELLQRHDHRCFHSANLSEERRSAMRNNLNSKARPKAMLWHKSNEGKEWHRRHGHEVAVKTNSVRITLVCLQCGNQYTTPKSRSKISKYCSNNCRQAYGRKHYGYGKKRHEN